MHWHREAYIKFSTCWIGIPYSNKQGEECSDNELVHVLNDCLEDEGSMYVSIGTTNYRNTGTHLKTLKSTKEKKSGMLAFSIGFRVLFLQEYQVRMI